MASPSAPEPLLRTATAADATLLSQFAARVFAATFANNNAPEDMADYLRTFSPEKQREELEAPDARVRLAFLGAELVAYAHLLVGRRPPLPFVAPEPVELKRFYVEPRHHGQGLALRLMEDVLALAKHEGCRTIWLGVWEHNPRAIAFYGKHGFVDVGAQPFQLGAALQTDRVMVRGVP